MNKILVSFYSLTLPCIIESSNQTCTKGPNILKNLKRAGNFVFFPKSNQSFSFERGDIRWCNVLVWITVLGLVSLVRVETDCLMPKFLSVPLLDKCCHGFGRARASRVEATSRITPTRINILHLKILMWTSFYCILTKSWR